MTEIDLNAFKALYIQIAKQYLQKLNQALIALEQDVLSESHLQEAYICAHSLKSQSMVMGYSETGSLAGLIEKILKGVKDQVLHFTPELLQALLVSAKRLEESVENIEKSGSEIIDSRDIQILEQVSGVKLHS